MINMMHRDCMEYMATLPDKAFDLAIVDPPYFDGPNKLGYYGAVKSKTKVKRQIKKDGKSKMALWRSQFGSAQRNRRSGNRR